MSYPESDISDLLDRDDTEELYNDVRDMVTYVDDHQNNGDILPNSLRTLEHQTMDLKPELLFNKLLNTSQIQSQIQHTSQSSSLPPVYNIPSRVCHEEYPGPHDFEVFIIPNNGTKNPWVFSPVLNKVFIDMGNIFPIDFRISSRPAEDLYVRVMPTFSSLQHSHDLVYSCIQHEHNQMIKNVPEIVRQHIIQCSSNPNVHYLGDRYKNQRLSIIFPLSYPPTGTDAIREMFMFVCKNSCVTGMNRRPVEIIFTLENQAGTILGRQILNVRICSCPKRDKEKEEKDYFNKGGTPYGKRRKLEVKSEVKTEKKTFVSEKKDKNIHTVTVDIVGDHNVQQVLKYCQDLMAGEMVKNPQNESFQLCYKKIQAQLNQLN